MSRREDLSSSYLTTFFHFNSLLIAAIFDLLEYLNRRLWQCALLLYLPTVITILFVCSPVFAEDKLPPAIPQVVISSKNFKEFKVDLTPELGQLIRDGVLSFRTKSDLDAPWHLGTSWEETSGQGGDSIVSFSQMRGFPYGGSDKVDRILDHHKLARAILWNGVASFSVGHLRSESLQMYHYVGGKLGVAFDLEFSRVYPGVISDEVARNQLQRERLAIKSPEQVSGSAVRAFRFFGEAEDLMWMDSRAIERTVSLTGSNRSDDLFHLPLSLDDMAVWGGKIENLTVTSVESVKVYMPFSDPAHIPGVIEDDELRLVYNQELEEGRPSSWESFSRHTSLIKRDAWRIEVLSNDAFYQFGRQVIMVDKESFMPITRLVYDRAGSPKRIVLGAPALAEYGSARVPFYPIILVHDYHKDEGVLVVNSALRVRLGDLTPTDMEQFNQPIFAPAKVSEDIAPTPTVMP